MHRPDARYFFFVHLAVMQGAHCAPSSDISILNVSESFFPKEQEIRRWPQERPVVFVAAFTLL